MNRLISVIILFSLIFIPFVSAWSRGTHDYSCPENYPIDCNIADSREFQENNPYANTLYHVCYDNKEDCMPRLAAKYFLKKYYIEEKTNKELLGATSHLFQDALCPSHWYPGFKIFGEDTYIFAPKWVKTFEGDVNIKSNQKEKWDINIEYKKEIININEDYLDNLEKQVEEFLSQEPKESLEEIEGKIKSKKVWHYLRAYQSFIIILFIILIPALVYELWKCKRNKRFSFDIALVGAISLLSILVFILTKIFY